MEQKITFQSSLKINCFQIIFLAKFLFVSWNFLSFTMTPLSLSLSLSLSVSFALLSEKFVIKLNIQK